MKKLTRKLLSLLLALMLTAGAAISAPLTASAADANGSPYPTINGAFFGECGAGTTYYCFPDGSMAIFGTGAIDDYTLLNGNTTAPWYRAGYDTMVQQIFIRRIFVEYGVTRIGNYSFYLSNSMSRGIILYTIDIANTVTSIGEGAFSGQSKIEELLIPPTVTEIGNLAFDRMASLKRLAYYGDPNGANLNWANLSSSPLTVHVLEKYKNNLPSVANVTFVADMTDPYVNADTKERNITAFYGSTNSKIFGGAATYIISGKYDNAKKSVTHGNAGFATCVKTSDDKIYMLTDNSTGKLYEVINTTGIAKGFDDNKPAPVSLQITHEYIGPDTVKMIYTLKNTSGEEITGLKLGSAGDIKIGADDTATIDPIKEGDNQIGFYMKSTNSTYDKSTTSTNPPYEYATFGFIGKSVKLNQTSESTADPANFFYGAVSNDILTQGAGAYTLNLYPEKIFTKPGNAQETGILSGVDSSMSFYWDGNNHTGITLAADEEKQVAVLFSVYGADTDANAQKTLKDDSVATEDSYDVITWDLNDKDDPAASTKVQQVVKKGATPVYPKATPVKDSSVSDSKLYHFTGWSQDGTTYIARYAEVEKGRLFKGHSISLGGDIALNFYLGETDDVTAAQLRDGKNVKVHFEWHVNGKLQTADVYTSDKKTVVENGTTYYLATCNLPAAEMAYNIHATAYVNNTLHWDSDIYSVKQYGMDLIGMASATEKEKALAKAMLNYGTMAQIQFDRIFADLGLANSLLSAEDAAAFNTAMDGITLQNIRATINAANEGKTRTKMSDSPDAAKLQYAGSSVVCLTTTSLRHYYKILAEGYPGSGNDNFKAKTEKAGYVYFEHENIPAAELDNFQEFTINGKTYYYSALDFVGNTLLDPSSTEAEKNLAKSMYLYNLAANAYFDNQTN